MLDLTPKGKIVKAWFYKGGAITGRLSPAGTNPDDSVSGKQAAVQDVKTNKSNIRIQVASF